MSLSRALFWGAMAVTGLVLSIAAAVALRKARRLRRRRARWLAGEDRLS